jgi:hypothetical protein
MRSGDFGIEVVPHGGGRVRELESGHVLARPGQVYRLRLRNHGPLYCVVDVDLDGHRVTAGGLVVEPWGTTELERPVDAAEQGRFTVVAEGDERVFGPDGGRDDPALGLVEARFRRELPRGDRRPEPVPRVELPDFPSRPMPGMPNVPGVPPAPRRFPVPPEWAPPLNAAPGYFTASAYDAVRQAPPRVGFTDGVERAAGTGLTGHSDQRFTPIVLGPLESEATTLTLRIVIGTEAALAEDDAPRPLAGRLGPARPAARP